MQTTKGEQCAGAYGIDIANFRLSQFYSDAFEDRACPFHLGHPPRAGLFFALWSMSTKLALALAVGIAFPALAALGFKTGQSNSGNALVALAVIYAWIPIVLKGGAIGLV